MRYVNVVTLFQLGLTEEEVAFLVPSANKDLQRFKSENNIDDKREFRDQIYSRGRIGQPDHFTITQRIQAEVSYALTNWGGYEKDNYSQPAVLDSQGFGLKHSSYGCVKVSRPSGNRSDLVGSASLMGYYIDISFGFAEVNSRDYRETNIWSRRDMFCLSLSGEQFYQLLRSNNQPVPCALQQLPESFPDSPPTLYPMLAKDKEYKRVIREICQPLTECMAKLGDALKAGVSKKSERDVVLAILGEAKVLFDSSRLEIGHLTETESREEVLRVERQFNAEIKDRLSTLGLEHLAGTLLLLK